MANTIAALYIYPILNATSPNLPAYNPNNPQQFWGRPLQNGEKTSDDYVYQYYESDASLHEFVISKGQAATPNIMPGNFSTVGGTIPVNNTVTPVPVDVTKLPVGAVVQPGESIMGIPALPVIVTPAVVPSTPTLADIEARLVAIENKLGISS